MSSRIFLVGPRGSGKSTVARHLADLLNWAWVDADTELETQAGQTIRDVFAQEGEAGFRERESTVLRSLCQRDNCIIATGGGVVLRSANRDLLRSAGVCVWLSADAETLWHRQCADTTTAERRPNLGSGGLAEVVNVLAAREALYREVADLSLDTRQPPEALARTIADWWAGRP